MEQLTEAIMESAALIKQIFISAATAQGDAIVLDKSDVWESISTIVQNFTAFMTQVVGEIAAKF
ncbi:MAG: hypothetical protein MUO92_03850 [Dehalococcoidales bacterium]|nr:hypothetical protein [Dehalococcoidales bacterium]